MKYCFWAYFLGLFFVFQSANAEENDLYSIINKQDKAAFSELLTSGGYEVDEQDLDGNTPLMIASALGKVDFVEYLLNMGANPNKKNYIGATALHRAAQGGHNDVIDLLIDNGAQVNMPDMDGVTPLMKAVEGERRFTVELLVHRGAFIPFMNVKKMSALDIAKKKRLNKIVAFLEEALKNVDKKEKRPKYSWE